MNRIKILLVDDDRIDRMAVDRLVRTEALPYDVDGAGSLAEAREKLHAGRYDMIMLDYMLGDGTGAELIPLAGDTPVIFVTGSGDELIAVSAMKMGAYDYLIKDPERNYLTILPQTIETVMARKKAEDAVRKLSSVVEQTAESVVITGRDGTIQYVNPAFCRLTGFAPEEALGQTPRILRSDFHAAAFYEDLWRTILAGKTFRAEFHNKRKNGMVYIEEKSISPIKDKQGEITHFVSTGRDVTSRKEAEEELRRQKERAEEATRLKDKFVSLVSHDLRGPLSTMLGFLKLISGDVDTPLTPEAAKRINIAIESAERMNEMIEELLSISRLKTGKIQPRLRFVSGQLLAAKAAMMYAGRAEAKEVMILNQVSEKCRLHADPALFFQVLQNLVNNAVKFSRQGETIRIFVPKDRPDTVAVADSGVGISPERLAKIFLYEEKTSTTGTAGEIGTGLGLPLSREIMQAHGGDLSAESVPGAGATFYARLPAARPLVLLVEDDPVSAKIITRMLSPLDVDLVAATNGKAGLALARERRPHIILSDLVMPEMDGYELIKELKLDEDLKGIPVIVLTSAGMQEREQVFLLGADDFVTKPASPEDLLPRIRRLIG